MHDIWNPWHGCKKVSPGCKNCYMFSMDKMRDQDGSNIYKTNNFDYPLQRFKNGDYKVKSGEALRVCLTSDFFLQEADEWRNECFAMMRMRPDISFILLTKRIERVPSCLPKDWGDGYENVQLNVSAENQQMADLRVPQLLKIPAKHKGVMCAPFLGHVDLTPYLQTHQLELVIAGGENYDGARPCDFSWVQALNEQCQRFNVRFCFIETGTHFVKDGKTYTLKSKTLQSEQAFKSGMTFKGQDIKFVLTDALGLPLPEDSLYKPHFKERCDKCGCRIICNGCSDCGNC